MRTFEKGKLSVIVPCYNVEEFIRECLDSLVHQTYKNIEVIMVDDGSPDHTGEILDEYDNAYENFHAVHTPNGGLSAARNAGLPYITGEYMAFVDSDDVVIEDAYARLIGSLMQTGSDMASGFVQRFNSRRSYSSGLHKKAIPETILKTNINKSTFLVYDTTAWNKVYKSTLFLNNSLRFPVGLTYEDIPVSMQLHLLAKNVDVIAEPVYKWRVRESKNQSITQKRESLKLFDDRIKTLRMAKSYIENLGGSEALKEAFNFKILDLDIAMYLDSFQNANEETLFDFQKAVYKFLRDYNLEDIKKLDIRRQIQYYAILEGDFTSFKQYGYQKKNVGKIKVKDNKKYIYINKSINKDVSKRISLNNAIMFKPSITNIQNDGSQITIDGRIKLKSNAQLLKVTKPVMASLINIENNEQIPIQFQQIYKRTKDSFYLKKIPSDFKVIFNIKSAESKIGPGKWKIRLKLNDKNIEIQDYLKGPKKMQELVLDPFDTPDYVLTNQFNRRWELIFNVVSKQQSMLERQNWIQDVTVRDNTVTGIAYIKNEIVNPVFKFISNQGTEYISDMKRVSDSENDCSKYMFEWNIYSLLPDTIQQGRIVLNDSVTNAMLDYKFQTARDVQTISEKKGFKVNVNYHYDKVALSLFKEKMTINKIKITDAGKINLLFNERSTDNIDKNSLTLSLSSADGKNSYKNFANIIVDKSNKFLASIELFDQMNKSLILSDDYYLYLNESFDEKDKQYLLTTDHLKSKLVGTISKQLFKASVWITDNGLIKIKMNQQWSNFDRTPAKRAINYSLLYPLMRLLPLQSKTVMFESLWGAYFNDNPKAIYEYWKKNHPDYKFVWSFTDLATPGEKGYEAVRKFSFKYWYYLARSRYLIENTNFPDQYAKRKGQVEVQTLHGTFMKTMGFDEPQFRNGSEKAQRNFMRRNNRWDYLISPSKYMDDKTAHAFDYKKAMLPVGFPRNDSIINGNDPQHIEELKKKMGLPKNKIIVLYAPTFRQNGVVDLELDIAKMQRALGDNYILLVRLHYLVANAVDLHEFSGFAVDMSSYKNIEDLYLVSDVLITDYSSVMFDYGYLRRPMIFFAYDLNWYLDAHNRGVYLDYVNTVPGPVVDSTEQVIEQLTKLDALKNAYHEKEETFYDEFCLYGRDGKAAEHTVETVLNNKLKYKQDYDRGLILTKFTHLLGLTDLKMDTFNYVGRRASRKKLVVFESDEGRHYSDSPRAIYEYMKKKHFDYKLVWTINYSEKKYFQRNHIPFVIRDSYRGIFTMARAKYWFTNSKMPENWIKPRGMKLVQTSSGTPLKKVGADVATDFIPGKTITKYQGDQVQEARKWDYLVAGNEYGAQILQNAYRKGTNQIVKSGLPRNDQLFSNNSDKQKKLKQKIGISDIKKIVLYAPTWRDNEVLNVDKYLTSLRLDIKKVVKGLPENTVLLVRFHDKVADNRPDLSKYGPRVLDVTEYPDMSDILMVTDILVTDYSSSIFDFANLRRPIIFFADDEKQYANQIRGLYVDYFKDLPGYFAKTTEEVIDKMNKLLSTPALPKGFKNFYEEYCSWEDGHSTEHLLKSIFKTEKYNVKQTSSTLIGKKVGISDGAQLWSKVYGSPNAHLLDNIDFRREEYVVSNVASLVDPIRGKQAGKLFARVSVGKQIGWISVDDLKVVE